MAKSLIIVESPAKAKTIKKYLGPGFTVKASVGHVKDLPEHRLGIDVAHNFAPEYVPIKGKKKLLQELRTEAEKAERVYLAPDPDREGEAIAWHIASELHRTPSDQIYRILLHEITKKGITDALQQPGRIDADKVSAQQARRPSRWPRELACFERASSHSGPRLLLLPRWLPRSLARFWRRADYRLS